MQGRTDIPLNETGCIQSAAAATQLLEDRRWCVILSSPLLRARASAEIISRATELPLNDPTPDLTERDYGVAEGLTVTDAHSRWSDGCFPGSEPAKALAERGRSCIEDVSTRHEGNLIVVSHGALIRATVTLLTGRTIPRILNGGIVIIESRSGQWWVERMPAPAEHGLSGRLCAERHPGTKQ